jgi:hypothetical protein
MFISFDFDFKGLHSLLLFITTPFVSLFMFF